MNSLKRTPLYNQHVALKGKIIDFGGWELPVQYEGILAEHKMVREKSGLFDVSHMGEIAIVGDGADEFVQSLITNDLNRIGPNETLYSPMCYENGGCVDDLIVYKYGDDDYLLVVNAANTDKDFAWITQHAPKELKVENYSERIAQLAIQGPMAESVLQKLTDDDLSQIQYFHFSPELKIDGKNCIVSRTGYTGEDGFEVYVKAEFAENLWQAILTAGGENIVPVGLGARDTLRFEAKLPLYGQEISADITPLEAGLGFFVRLETEADFIGKTALTQQKTEGLKRCLCEFEMLERGIPRAHYDVLIQGEKAGFVTTGMFAPTLQKNIGLAMIPTQYREPGTRIEIMIRNKPVMAEVKKGIFYHKKTKKR